MNLTWIQQFKQDFLKAPLLSLIQQELEDNDEILAISLSGSRITPYTHKNSDIDIAIYTKRTQLYHSKMKFKYHDMHGHWWYQSLDPYVITADWARITGLFFAGRYAFKFLNEEDFIYINPKYPAFVNLILKYKEDISQWGLVHLWDFDNPIYYNLHMPRKWMWVWLDYYATIDSHFTNAYQEIQDIKQNRMHCTIQTKKDIIHGWEEAKSLDFLAINRKIYQIIIELNNYISEVDKNANI